MSGEGPGAVRVARARLQQVQLLAARYAREALDDAAVHPPLPSGALFWLATGAEGTTLGYAAGRMRAEGLVLGPVYVPAEHRRKGIGIALLEEVHRFAAGPGLPVEVSVAATNEAGRRFLESAGFGVRRLLLAREEAPSA